MSETDDDEIAMGLGGFLDAPYWRLLEKRYLSSYNLPKWSVMPTTEAMEWWLERMGKTRKWYEKDQMTTLKEYIDANPGWPLRAWIGETLELIDEDN